MKPSTDTVLYMTTSPMGSLLCSGSAHSGVSGVAVLIVRKAVREAAPSSLIKSWPASIGPDSRSPTAMSFAVVSSLYPHTQSTALEESIVTATYTFDVFSSLDGFGGVSGGNWGGYWGKQGPELLDHRLALYGEEQRMVFGA